MLYGSSGYGIPLFHMAVCLSPLKDKALANLKCIKYVHGVQAFRSFLIWEERVLLKTVC